MTMTPTIEDRALPVILDRPFFTNRFVSTHQSLLLRSPKGVGYLERTDVLFKGVVALKIVSKLPTLGVRLASPDEAAVVKTECGEDVVAAGGLQIYMLEGANTPGYVVALSMFACSVNGTAAIPAVALRRRW